ncbi:hypothetical protein ACKXGF_14360 (plasmid) [Alkalibacillus sp. S2W]|uniref:hypothetical protein n=1 Tax=Alkalibacillus sp. S2W TaxID=3386553 RepID=UPI00398D5114
MTDSDTDQKESGFLVRNQGAQKLSSLSSSDRHTHNFKNKFLAGASIGGVDLGYAQTFIDQSRVYSSGNAYWTMD